MKALSFEVSGRASYGVLSDDGVHEVIDQFLDRYADLKSVLAAGELRALEMNVSEAVLRPTAQFTAGGVGAAHKPPLWLREGDLVEVDIGALGCLQNRVQDE